MGGLRVFLHRHRTLAALLLALALCVKAIVPAGYMPGGGARFITVSICADASGGEVTRQIAIPARGDAAQDHARAKGECAFAGLAMAALGGADMALLAAALAFILALGFAEHAVPAPRDASRLRPPLRGPPLAA